MEPLTKLRRERTRIAIVGSSCRMPGVGGEGLWEALIAGRDLVSSVEPGRWSTDSLLHPRKSEPGSSYTFAAGSIGDVSGFDAAFFGISPREAAQMDPQQRLLLEMSWEAFEQAAIRPSSVRGSRCGVFVGISALDYAYCHADDLGSIDATTMTGSTGSIAANRISYAFDLRGPSMAVDTACSSSLVALHQACQSIRLGESDAALVGGISLHLHPYAFVGFSKASMLSPHGRCRVFDERGDGYVRSEGGAVVLLKPLAQALKDGNRILGVIVETGVNNDGRKTGLTVPSHSAQAALLREVYERAGFSPAQLDYLEAHGTGTAVGDPIEALALGEALGRQRPPDQPLPIGSIKSQVGHLEAASGMAGLMKVLQVLRHRCVPANLHLEKPNPAIDFEGLNLAPVTAPLTLEAGRRLVVGVSAFGFGGTNAHAVLTSFDPEAARPPAYWLPQAPLMLSARSPAALKDGARRMARFLGEHPELADYDIAYSAMFARDVHSCRLSVSADDRVSLTQALEQFAESGSGPGVVTGKFRRDASAPAFVFSGNGSQWVGMGLRLLEEEPVFRETLEEIGVLFAARSGRSILEDLRAAPVAGGFERTEIAQPALFAVQVGLTRLFEQRGIRPIAVCGHSVGEVAAAWASGALSLEAAVRVIHERSAHQAPTRGGGGMAAVALGEAETARLLASLGLDSDITITAANSGASVTVAGSDRALTHLGSALARRRIGCRRLALDYAFHSPSMDPIRDELVRSLSSLACEAGAVPLYSTVTGAVLDGSALGAEHWWHNIRRPVRFQAAIESMIAAGINTFVEIGPRPVLLSYLNEIGTAAGVSLFTAASLTTNEAGVERIRSVIEQLELSGALHDPARLFPVAGQWVELPHYAWQRERHWYTSSPESQGLLGRRAVHPLLGYALSGDAPEWENHLDTARLPLLADHAVAGSVVFPASGFVEMALAAAAQLHPGSLPVIEDFEIHAPLVLEREHSKVVRLRLEPQDGTFSIRSRERACADNWRTHVVGRLAGPALASGVTLELPTRAADVSAPEHYALSESLGLRYGPAFRAVGAAWYGEGSTLIGALTTPECIAGETQSAQLHPAYLDGALQLFMDLACHERGVAGGRAPLQAFLPVRIERLELLRPGVQAVAARLTPTAVRHRSGRALAGDLTLHDGSGALIACVRGVRLRAASLAPAALDAPSWIRTRAIPKPRRAGGPALTLPTSAELLRLSRQALLTPPRVASRRRFGEEVEPLLDALCAAFAERTLRELADGGAIDPEALRATCHVSADGTLLLCGLLQLLAEEGVVQAIDGQWRWSAAGPHFPAPEDIWSRLIGDYPEYGSIIARVGTAGLRLRERLSGAAEAEPRERRIDDSTFAWVDTCVEDETASIFAAVEAVLAAAAAAQPAEARLRVLYVVGGVSREEVGGEILPRLDPERCDLVLAARGRESLDEFQARYPLAAQLARQVLDLDGTGVAGAEAPTGRFDVIVLGEGLSGAPDPQTRLASLRQLLFDGGLLLLIDQHGSRAADLSYGLDPRWWLVEGAGARVRVRSRQRGPRAWEPALADAGFADVLPLADAPAGETGPYLIAARAAAAWQGETTPEHAPAAARTWLIACEPCGYSAQLASELTRCLEARGQRVIPVTNAERSSSEDAGRPALDAGSADEWQRLIAELQRVGINPDAWVHLAGLDLATAGAAAEARARACEARAAVLAAWLKGSARVSLRADTWVIGSQSGLALLPPWRHIAANGAAGHGASSDRVRDAALWGLARVAMQEHPELKLRWVDLADPLPADANADRLTEELLEPDAEDEILLTAAGRFVPRIATDPEAPSAGAAAATGTAAVHLDFAAPGPFRNLTWRNDVPRQDELAAEELEIEVRAAGLNFRDVMYAMGLLPDEAIEDGFCGPTLGMEASGVVLRAGPDAGFVPGDEVIAIAPAAFASRIRTRAFAVTRKPAEWSFTAAATVPTAFFTAYYALAELAQVQPGERVLIHGAAGGVGIAAIQIARHLGAEVLATAGTPEKRDFVRLLGADRVFDSRSLTFADEIVSATGGEGVDVVLNSLAGEAMRRNLRLLRPFGRMIELGKRDFYENSRLGLRPFRNNIAYFGIDADQLIARRPQVAQRVLGKLMELFAEGVLSPLPHRAFGASNVETAFRHMQASRHLGKVVISFPPGFSPNAPARVDSAPRVLRAEATYLITGGLSGFGLRTASWLIARGARHLALVGRSGVAAPDAAQSLAQLAASGVTVRTFACDVADGAALRRMLEALRCQMPPLRGIVHAAMVIEDALIRDLERGQLKRVLAPKIAGALNLHAATQAHELDFFLLYSSATTLFGNPGQGAYVAANMALEALAAERRALGLRANCVSWGPIGDTGYLARNERIREALVGRIGRRALSADEALGSLDAVLAADASGLGVLELDWGVLSRFLPAARAPKFTELARAATLSAADEPAPDLRRTLAELPEGERLPALTEVVRKEIAQILRIAVERVETNASLFELGMDSLMAVELAMSLEARLGIAMTALSLADAPTIERIAARVAQQLLPADRQGAGAAPAEAGVAEQVRLLAARHAEEVSRETIGEITAEFRVDAAPRIIGHSS